MCVHRVLCSAVATRVFTPGETRARSFADVRPSRRSLVSPFFLSFFLSLCRRPIERDVKGVAGVVRESFCELSTRKATRISLIRGIAVRSSHGRLRGAFTGHAGQVSNMNRRAIECPEAARISALDESRSISIPTPRVPFALHPRMWSHILS